MPIYEYQCADCGKSFEVIRPMSDADKQSTCPTCGSDHSKRKLSVVNCHGTGSGASSGGCGSCSGSHCATCGH